MNQDDRDPSAGPDSSRVHREPVGGDAHWRETTKAMRVELSTPGPPDEADFLAAMLASRELHNPWIFPPLTPEDYAMTTWA